MTVLARPGDGGEGRRLLAAFLAAAAAHGALAAAIVASTQLDREGECVDSEVQLRPDEGLVLRLKSEFP